MPAAKILVTGAAGFIGSHTCDQLLAAGHRVVGVDDRSTGYLRNLAHAIPSPNFTFVEDDVSVPDRLLARVSVFRPDAIIHLAALVSVPRSFAEAALNQ